MRQQSGCGGAVVSFDAKAADAGDARRRALHVIDSTHLHLEDLKADLARGLDTL